MSAPQIWRHGRARRHLGCLAGRTLTDRVVRRRLELNPIELELDRADALAPIEACDIRNERLEREDAVDGQVRRDVPPC
jgi:hypothetical protein